MAGELKLTNEQVISLLSRMDTEENTLRPLWDQFTVARRQARSVIEHLQSVLAELPGLEDRKVGLEEAITLLGPALARRKAETNQEYHEFRQALEEESIPLQKAVTDLREQVIALRAALANEEQVAETRRLGIRDEILKAETRLAEIRRDFDEFKREHGLV